MRCFLILATTAAVALAALHTTEAADRHGRGTSGDRPVRPHDRDRNRPGDRDHKSGVKEYHLKHGKKLKSGDYVYVGRDHHHWKGRYYWKKYRCNCYWCPSVRCWYYWCPSEGAYYPVSYIASEPPDPEDDDGDNTVDADDDGPTVTPDGAALKR